MNNYNYIFWNNTYENIWYAIPTTQTLIFFNGNRKLAKGVIKDTDIKKLLNKIK